MPLGADASRDAVALHSDAPTFIATDAWLSRSDFDAVDLNVVRSTSSNPSS